MKREWTWYNGSTGVGISDGHAWKWPQLGRDMLAQFTYWYVACGPYILVWFPDIVL